MSAENEKLVTDFCQSWTRKNVDEILGYLTDDCFYHNIPMEPCVGKAAIRKFIDADATFQFVPRTRDVRGLDGIPFDVRGAALTHRGGRCTFEVLLETYELLAHRVVHVHLSNYDGRQHRLPQDGSLALGPFLAALRRRGYEGAIVVELMPDALGAGDDGRVRERLAETVAFCRTHFAGR